LKEFIKPKDDWVEEDKLLERFNKEMQNNFETNLLNVESIIESCSQKSYVLSFLQSLQNVRTIKKHHHKKINRIFFTLI
jgi:hypothetical protein